MAYSSRSTAQGRVEKSVTGKELEFQKNREFGPGAMKPYPYSKPGPGHGTNQGVYYGGRRSGSGVYGGPSRSGSRTENPGLGYRRYLGPGRLT